jgi:hypothetical protein
MPVDVEGYSAGQLRKMAAVYRALLPHQPDGNRMDYCDVQAMRVMYPEQYGAHNDAPPTPDHGDHIVSEDGK